MVRKLKTRPPRRDRRIDSQLAVIDAITKRTNFGLRCFLTQFRHDNPYGYRAPQDLGEFEFSVKGVLRLEMMNSQDEDYLFWRRLFGTTTGEKTGRRAGEFVGKPASWKSRVLFKAFKNGKEAREFLVGSSLNRWPGGGLALLAEVLTGQESGPLLLLQLHDVKLDDHRTFGDLLTQFLAQSEVLQLLGKPLSINFLGATDE
jgi:hypothetical protein